MRFLVVLFLFFAESPAQNYWTINPGFKLGYAFGPKGGFIGGFEVSITTTPPSSTSPFAFGAFVSIEHGNNYTITHLGGEIFYKLLFGASIGPTFYTSETSNDFGLTSTAFAGAIVLPYFRYSIYNNQPNIPEVGSFFKWPIPLRKVSLSVG